MEAPTAFVLHNAAEAGNAELLQRLLLADVENSAAAATEVGVPLGQDALKELLSLPDLHDCTPLHLAILNGHVGCAEVLLQAGSSPNAACDGTPPLHMAVCTALMPGRAEAACALVQLLLNANAQPTETDDGSRSAVHWAAELGLLPALELLLDACQKETQRQLAAYREAAAADAAAEAEAREAAAGGEGAPPAVKDVELPTSLPSIVEMQDADGNTPLHSAVRIAAFQGPDGSDAAVKALLNRDRDWDVRALVKSRNKDGHTPLHLAALHNRLAAVCAMCAASPRAVPLQDKKGRTAAQLASSRGYKEVAELLEKAAQSKVSGVSEPATPGPTSKPPLLFIAPEECLSHYTAPEPITRGDSDPPPENINRLHVLTRPGCGILHGREFAQASWETQGIPSAAITDVLRCHEWSYLRGLLATCSALPDDPQVVGRLDPDTSVSHHSYTAALKAAGAVCSAVDRLVSQKARSVFCPVRPPGHHAGPVGSVPSGSDPTGSHGFCLLSNVAIGAAYAMNMYRHQGVRRVAILDFDVHHGNGSQAVVANTQPSTQKVPFKTPFSEGVQVFPTFKPWLDFSDADNIFFASVQGYGRHSYGGWFYPGSGATEDTRPSPATRASGDAAQPLIPEDPNGEFTHSTSDTGGSAAPTDGSDPGPRIINVGIPGPGAKRQIWRRAWRDKILPALVNFNPDMIFISAGFDAHKKDVLNMRYVGIVEADYEWLTDQITQVANRCCNGRIVSVLEGGYNLQGGIVSAFARSVAAHVRALGEPHLQTWDPRDAELEREAEARRQEAKLAAAGLATPAHPPPPKPEEEAGPSAQGTGAAPSAPSAPPQQAEGSQAQGTAAQGTVQGEGGSGVGGPSGTGGSQAAPMDVDRGAAASGQSEGDQSGKRGTPLQAARQEEEGAGKRRRRGPAVDYAQLNAQLEAKKAAEKAAGGGGST